MLSDSPTVRELIDSRWPDWDFDDVPDSELVACCHWEYARESWTLGMEAKLYWLRTRHIWRKDEYLANPELKRNDDEVAARTEKCLEEFGYDGENFSNRFWETDFPLLELYRTITDHGGPEATPWQELNAEWRSILAAEAKKSYTLRPLAPALVVELEQLWNSNSREVLEIRSRNLPPNDDSEDCALFSESSPIEIDEDEASKPSEKIAVGFTIDFSRFTDREIIESFNSWLKKSRPAHWMSPRRVIPASSRRGCKLLDYKVALERLGLMRLLHQNSPDELRDFHPSLWERIRRDETHFRRECRYACEMFRRLFPFLPEDELPLSAEPVEVWEPRILAALAEEEQQDRPTDTGFKSQPI